jgi:AAA domain-containing protein
MGTDDVNSSTGPNSSNALGPLGTATVMWAPRLQTEGGDPIYEAPLRALLTTALDAYPDACLVPYVCTPARRLKSEDAAAATLVWAPVDIDGPRKAYKGRAVPDEVQAEHEAWTERTLTLAGTFRVPPVAWVTPNGIRLLWALVPASVTPAEYPARHAALLGELASLGITGIDPGCSDWTRLQRLPRGREIFVPPGGVSEIELPPAAPAAIRAAPALGTVSGPVTENTLFRMLEAKDPEAIGAELGDVAHVRCPWDNEHSNAGSPIDSSTVILADRQGKGMGVFVCKHAHCAHRGNVDVLAELRQDPAAARILEEHDTRNGRAAEALLGIETVANDNAEPSAAAPAATDRLTARLAALKVHRWDDFRKPMPPVRWLCKDLGIGPGRPTVAVGKPGSGKTWSTQALALAVAGGLPVFGRFPVREGRVVHLDMDQGAATQVRYRQLAVGMGLTLRDLPLEVYPFPFKLVDPDAKAMLLRMCDGAALCIVDALRGAIPGDENDSTFAEPLTMLSAVSDVTGCVFQVIHHEGKADKTGADVLRGTTALPAAAGAVHRYVLEDGGVRLTRERASEYDARRAFDPVRLHMALTPSADPWLFDSGDGTYFDAVTIEVATGAPEWLNAGGGDDLCARIRRLASQDPGLSTSSLYAKLGGNKQHVFEKVRVMSDAGMLFNGGSDTKPKWFGEKPSEVLRALIEAASSAGINVGALSEATRLSPGQLAPHLGLLKQRGDIEMWELEGVLICRTRNFG